MTIVEITGGMLRAARSLAGLSQQELAGRAAISRRCLTAWEGSSESSDAIPAATYCQLTSLSVSAERFSGDGVYALVRHAAYATRAMSRNPICEGLTKVRRPAAKFELVPRDRLPNLQNKFRC